jgi:hypothetical protein
MKKTPAIEDHRGQIVYQLFTIYSWIGEFLAGLIIFLIHRFDNKYAKMHIVVNGTSQKAGVAAVASA